MYYHLYQNLNIKYFFKYGGDGLLIAIPCLFGAFRIQLITVSFILAGIDLLIKK